MIYIVSPRYTQDLLHTIPDDMFFVSLKLADTRSQGNLIANYKHGRKTAYKVKIIQSVICFLEQIFLLLAMLNNIIQLNVVKLNEGSTNEKNQAICYFTGTRIRYGQRWSMCACKIYEFQCTKQFYNFKIVCRIFNKRWMFLMINTF